MTKKHFSTNPSAQEASGSIEQSGSRSTANEPTAESPALADVDSPSPPITCVSKQNPPSGSHPTDMESEPAQPPAVQRASAYSVAQEQLTRVAKIMHLDDDMRVHLCVPRRELIVHFPVVMDDSTTRMFTGFRVHHNTALGPTKGGIRYHPDVTLDEIASIGHVDDVEMRVDESALWRPPKAVSSSTQRNSRKRNWRR